MQPVAWTRAEALRSRAFWSVCGPVALSLVAQVGFLVHQIAILEVSLGRTGAGFAVAITTIAALLGRLLLGAVADRLDPRIMAAISLATQAAAMTATEDKNEKRADAEKVMRKFVNILQVSPQVSDPERAALRIPIRDKQPTPTDPNAILNIIPPKQHLGTEQPGLVVVHFGPNPLDERRNAKPKGVAGGRILVIDGSVPSGTANIDSLPWRWAGDDTESPFYFKAPAGGIFTFRVQWFDVLMNLGPLGDPVTCAVTA